MSATEAQAMTLAAQAEMLRHASLGVDDVRPVTDAARQSIAASQQATEVDKQAIGAERPIFVELADRIADDILGGLLEEDTQVPSTNELAAFYRINPATAGKALNRLVDAGVLTKRRGVGMFVAPGAQEALRGVRQAAFTDEYIRPLLAEAHRLGLTTDHVVALIRTQPQEKK